MLVLVGFDVVADVFGIEIIIIALVVAILNLFLTLLLFVAFFLSHA